jgi:hypothetical protein
VLQASSGDHPEFRTTRNQSDCIPSAAQASFYFVVQNTLYLRRGENPERQGIDYSANNIGPSE